MKCKAHLAAVAELPCCICLAEPVEVHHLRHPALTGTGLKAGDLFTIPLCPACHRDFHESRRLWEMRHGSQFNWLEDTLYRLMYGGHK